MAVVDVKVNAKNVKMQGWEIRVSKDRYVMFCRNKFVVSGYIPQCMKCVVKQKETIQRENTLFQ